MKKKPSNPHSSTAARMPPTITPARVAVEGVSSPSGPGVTVCKMAEVRVAEAAFLRIFMPGFISMVVPGLTAEFITGDNTKVLWSSGSDGMKAWDTDNPAVPVYLETAGMTMDLPSEYYDLHITPRFPYLDQNDSCICAYADTRDKIGFTFVDKIKVEVDIKDLIRPMFNWTSVEAGPGGVAKALASLNTSATTSSGAPSITASDPSRPDTPDPVSTGVIAGVVVGGVVALALIGGAGYFLVRRKRKAQPKSGSPDDSSQDPESPLAHNTKNPRYNGDPTLD
ncbi:hypothetical protein CBER1_07538 [Cercospora berteroae]|uniref:Peptidase A1 domain-containing protein n=1 Tax=Cercospora berteroae TaxID=357750 RepID=A0A2S6BU95_9PEZI|nr:hypothetical protein CBER1_07538 [Cercospora berteroae]